MYYAIQNCMTEWTFRSGKIYRDPFNEVTLDVMFIDPDGEEHRIPAFWAGEQTWRVRYASPKVGTHRYRSVCSDNSNADLHGQEGVLEVTPYEGNNPLLRHGPLRVNASRRYLEHLDRTPFFWLGDTWWMGLCKRLRFPGDFKLLTADRVEKEFTVIQIVAGLYPDMPAFDERGANEAGFPWEKDYARINPAYFDMADLRIDWLVRSGLVPCIVGCWGYFLPWMGVEKMKKHWRNLVARYGAYPVIWCLAGEGIMPYYRSENKEQDSAFQKKGWTEIGVYLRQVDSYRHLVTIHPGSTAQSMSARDMVDDSSLIDIDMLQTGHNDLHSFPVTVDEVARSIADSPRMPVINGEVCYEGEWGENWENVQRLMFWTSILNGAAGHTYGATGIWQVNTKEAPFGPSPHGLSWGNIPWKETYQLPGARQLGLGKQLLQRYEWWRFEPHPEWVEPHASKEDYYAPYAAGIPKEVRIVYISPPGTGLRKVKMIEPEISYHAFYFDPTNGDEYDIGTVVTDEKDEWQPPNPSIALDWILVMEAKR